MKKASALLLAAFLAGAALPCRAASPGLEKAVRSLADKLLKADAVRGSAVAVLPFSVQGADPSLRSGAAELLAAELRRSGRLTVVEGDYLSLPDRAPADLGGAAYLVRGSLESAGKNKLTLQASLLAAPTGPVLASAKASLKPEDAAPEPLEQAAQTAVLPGTGPDSCRWLEASASAPLTGSPDSQRAAAILAARYRALRAVMSLPAPRPLDLGQEALRGRSEPLLRALRSGRVREEEVRSAGPSGGRFTLTLRSCVDGAGLSRDKDFSVALLLSQQRLFRGQKARAAAVSNRDGFVYFFLTDLAGSLTPVEPAPTPAGTRVIAGRPFYSTAFDAPLPEGEKPSVVIVRALSVRRDASAIIAKALGWSDLLRRLDESGEGWAEDARVLTVYPPPR